MPVTAEDVSAIALALPRATSGWVRDSRRFRVGRLVFAAMDPAETRLGFGYPREQRDGLIAGDPAKFLLPRPSELRYQWVVARMEALDVEELAELLTDAWTMCVPKSVAAAYLAEPTRSLAEVGDPLPEFDELLGDADRGGAATAGP